MAKKVIQAGPLCPNCGKVPYDIVRMESQPKGPPIKKTVWYCPSVTCNPMANVMSDDQVWSGLSS